jgi:hypothetical protein
MRSETSVSDLKCERELGQFDAFFLVLRAPCRTTLLGLKERDTFSEGKLRELAYFIRKVAAGDSFSFMATFIPYFPFLTFEVKCGTEALDVADEQNAHIMTLAVRAVAELFHTLCCSTEIKHRVVPSSVSQNHRSVRIYGH